MPAIDPNTAAQYACIGRYNDDGPITGRLMHPVHPNTESIAYFSIIDRAMDRVGHPVWLTTGPLWIPVEDE